MLEKLGETVGKGRGQGKAKSFQRQMVEHGIRDLEKFQKFWLLYGE